MPAEEAMPELATQTQSSLLPKNTTTIIIKQVVIVFQFLTKHKRYNCKSIRMERFRFHFIHYILQEHGVPKTASVNRV